MDPSAALDDPERSLRTHLIIDRARLSAVLLRNGRPVFRTGVGLGRPQWPTPRGEFYVRVRLTHFLDRMYGPVALGTNARQPWLTDWPNGGVVESTERMPHSFCRDACRTGASGCETTP